MYKLYSVSRSNLNLSLKFEKSMIKSNFKNYSIITNSQEITLYPTSYFFQQMMHYNRNDFIPPFLRLYHPRYYFRGIKRSESYRLPLIYMEQLHKKIRETSQQIKKKQNTTQKQNSNNQKKEQPNKTVQLVKLQFLFKIMAGSIGYFIIINLFDLKVQFENKDLLNINKKQLKQSDIQRQKNLLLFGTKRIHIKQLYKNNIFYQIIFDYQDGRQQTSKYQGNINNFLKMVQNYQLKNSQKAKILFQGFNKYQIPQAMYDTFKLITPFVGIAITIYLFTKFNPDNFMNSFKNKKSFKIQGERNIRVKFEDVAGMQQAKKQITQFVDFLKQGEKYKQMGAKIPKGALLTGPPGTGKTLLAKACAGQAGVSFFSISGSQFVQIFVGVGASKVRDLFAKARAQSPAIIFIDQIDAIGRSRQNSRNQQKDSTLNQLLVQMDGFGTNQTVIVLAATNRKDILDSALTRPGRFDRMVEVSLPDLKARKQIFKVHLKPLKVDPNRTIQQIANRLSQLSPGFSGADISNLCNEAALIATRRKHIYIQDKDFQDASQRITAGYEKKGMSNKETKKRVAFHEAGHAVCGYFLKGGNPLVKLTIVPRSKGALGYAQYLPKTSYIQTKGQIIDQITILLAGLTSEQLFLGSRSSGNSDDLQKVYQLARKMISDYGMGQAVYNITIDEESQVRKQSQFLLKKVQEEMLNIVQQARQKCMQLLKQKQKQIYSLAQMLLQKQTITGDDIKKILGQRPNFA